jgi:hypothetical protein
MGNPMKFRLAKIILAAIDTPAWCLIEATQRFNFREPMVEVLRRAHR